MREAEDAWMSMARDNLKAARGLAVAHPRSSTSRGDRQRLLDALREAWAAEAGVRDFGLQYIPRTIEDRHRSWIVPVAVGGEGSAYDLLRILDRLQESVERRSSLDVSMFFDPRLVPESGGVN